MSKGFDCMRELFASWQIERYKLIRREKQRGVGIRELNDRFGRSVVKIALNKKTRMAY